MTTTLTNKYAGECRWCGQPVEAGQGIVTDTGAILGGRPNRYGRYTPRHAWETAHRPARWVGAPSSGRWVDGCPEVVES